MTIQEMIDSLEHFKKAYGPDVKVGKRIINACDGSVKYVDIKVVKANYVDANDVTTLIVNV